MTLAANAYADDTQNLLSRQIEDASKTSSQAFFGASEGVGWSVYTPLLYRREMQVTGCDITLITTMIDTNNATSEPSAKITFDLARAQIPSPAISIGTEYAFMLADGDAPYGTALFNIRFVPPYEPIIWSMTLGQELEQPVTFTQFSMTPVSDEAQPRRLLTLLTQYQAEYCNFVG